MFVEDAFENSFFPLGFAGRVSFLPLKRGRAEGPWHYLGPELDVSGYRLDEEKKNYTVTAQVMGVQINLLYQLWLPDRSMVLDFRFGVGITAIWDFSFDYGNGGGDSLSSAYPSLGGGISIQWFIIRRLYIEAGVDFIQLLSFSGSSSPGYLRPVVGAGWQF
jgi:hypothetical protein